MGTNFEGYWGHPTSTVQWCEKSYEVSSYIVEFWNTISNMAMLIPSAWAIHNGIKDRIDFRDIISHLILFIVGVGSWCFHMTRKYEMQLLDEMPMVWGELFLIYSLAQIKLANSKACYILAGGLFSYGLLFSIIYTSVKLPILLQLTYGIMVAVLYISDTYYARTIKCEVWLKDMSALLYLVGFIFWCLDNTFCAQLTWAREYLPALLVPFTQFHAVWHVAAAYGTYFHILYICCVRFHCQKRKYTLKTSWIGVEVRSSIKEPVLAN